MTFIFTYNNIHFIFIMIMTLPPPRSSEEGVHPLYGLSYCLNYCWGTAATVLFSLLATLLTGGILTV